MIATNMFMLFFLVLFTQTTAEEITSNPCLEGWIQATWVDLGCLLFNTIKEYHWEEAANYCQTENPNSTLVDFQNPEQLEFLQMELEAIEDHAGTTHWWTSGTDMAREGEWYWESDLTPVPEFVWFSGQPDDGIGYNCLMLHTSYDYLGGDFDCGFGAYPICQMEV